MIDNKIKCKIDNKIKNVNLLTNHAKKTEDINR